MDRSAWARTHIGEIYFRLGGVEQVMDTEWGIVAKIDDFNIAVDVTDDGWKLRLFAVKPMSWTLIEEWDMPAIAVPAGFLGLCQMVSSNG